MAFKIVLGDITKMDTTAIVNAANTSLLGGGGVDGAIHRAAGPELLAECRMLHGCKTGQAKITKGYRLKAKYVIHTPGPYYSGGNHNEPELLESCYRSCLELALKKGISDIAFPSISTGIYHFPLDQASAIAVKTIHEYPQINTVMVCFDEKTKQAYEQAEQAYLSKKSEEDISIEFCNLPMKTAFQNENLAGQIGMLLAEYGLESWLPRFAHSDRTFHQFTCLGENELPTDLIGKINEIMNAQDKINPYPLTRMYPYLLENSWQLSMREVSSIKVNIKYGNDWSLAIERIFQVYSSLAECPMLCFYPYESEPETGITIEDSRGDSLVRVYPDTRYIMQKMMKQILLQGTLDLREYGWNPLNKSRFWRLTRFLKIFGQANSFGTWIIDRKSAGTAEDPIQMPFIDYSEEVCNFMKVMHDFADEYSACDLHHYKAILEEYGLGRMPLEEADASDLDSSCILAMLMAAVRGERFCEGLLESLLQKGRIQVWLERLKDCEQLNGKQ